MFSPSSSSALEITEAPTQEPAQTFRSVDPGVAGQGLAALFAASTRGHIIEGQTNAGATTNAPARATAVALLSPALGPLPSTMKDFTAKEADLLFAHGRQNMPIGTSR